MVDAVAGDGGIIYPPAPMERPKTSHGRRSSAAAVPVEDVHIAHQPDKAPSPVPRPRTSRSNRPRTSHGRRPPDQQLLMQQHEQRNLQQQQYEEQQSRQQQQQQPDPSQYRGPEQGEPIPRPRTSHGRKQRRRSSVQQLSEQDIASSSSFASSIGSPDPFLAPARSIATPHNARPKSGRPMSGRPMSGRSLSRYSVLPSIGTKVDPSAAGVPPPPSPPAERPGLGERSVTMLNLKNDVQVMRLDDDDDDEPTDRANEVLVNNDKGDVETSAEPEPGFLPLTRENTLSEEPKPEEADTILLAVKLPNGQRVQRHFRMEETMEMVRHFAEVSSLLDLSGYEIVCDAPRKIFSDLTVTVGESGLVTRTVLHIRFPDE